MPSRRSLALRLSVGLVVAAALTACTSAETPAAAPAASPTATSTVDSRLQTFAFPGGTVGVPTGWEQLPAAPGSTTLASFQQVGPGGEPVAQLDLNSSTVPPGSAADALDASVQANRGLQVRRLQSVERRRAEAPGAADAFRTEATYALPDDAPARSLEQSTVTEDGLFVLVRYSSGEPDFDRDLATAVLDSLRLDAGAA